MERRGCRSTNAFNAADCGNGLATDQESAPANQLSRASVVGEVPSASVQYCQTSQREHRAANGQAGVELRCGDPRCTRTRRAADGISAHDFTTSKSASGSVAGVLLRSAGAWRVIVPGRRRFSGRSVRAAHLGCMAPIGRVALEMRYDPAGANSRRFTIRLARNAIEVVGLHSGVRAAARPDKCGDQYPSGNRFHLEILSSFRAVHVASRRHVTVRTGLLRGRMFLKRYVECTGDDF